MDDLEKAVERDRVPSHRCRTAAQKKRLAPCYRICIGLGAFLRPCRLTTHCVTVWMHMCVSSRN